MNIALAPDQLAGLAYGAARSNAANSDASPMTDEEFATNLLGVQCRSYAAGKADAEKGALASNAPLMAVGLVVASTFPDKQDTVIAAARAGLAQP